MVERGYGLRPVAEWQRHWRPLGQYLVSWPEHYVSWIVYELHRKLFRVLKFIHGILETVSRELSLTMHAIDFVMSSRYWEVQVEIGENVQGWVFWTWKVWHPSVCQ